MYFRKYARRSSSVFFEGVRHSGCWRFQMALAWREWARQYFRRRPRMGSGQLSYVQRVWRIDALLGLKVF
jgi:hypothetical protein